MQASFVSSNPCSDPSAAGSGGNKTKSEEEEDESSFMKKLKSGALLLPERYDPLSTASSSSCSCLRGLPNMIPTKTKGPPWSMGHDIFAYGILLLELINKRVYVGFMTPTWMEEEFLDCHRSDHKKSAVDDSFCVEEYVAMGITKLAINCLKVNSDEQPTIRCIVGELRTLSCMPHQTNDRRYLVDFLMSVYLVR